MGTIIFIFFCLIIIILSYKMLDDNLFEKLVDFLFGFVFISMGIIVVGLVLYLLYYILTSTFG